MTEHRVEILYIEDCPNWRVTDARLTSLSLGQGFTIQRTLVRTAAEAERIAFRGSPTVLVDGVDPFASGDEPVGLACRIYHTPVGTAGSPTLEQLREAVVR